MRWEGSTHRWAIYRLDTITQVLRPPAALAACCYVTFAFGPIWSHLLTLVSSVSSPFCIWISTTKEQTRWEQHTPSHTDINWRRSRQICLTAAAVLAFFTFIYLIVMRQWADSSSIIKRQSTELRAVPAHHRNVLEFNTSGQTHIPNCCAHNQTPAWPGLQSADFSEPSFSFWLVCFSLWLSLVNRGTSF